MPPPHSIRSRKVTPPLVTGDDLVQHGLSPGPRFKELLEAVREAQLEGTVKTREEGLQLVDQLIAT